MPTRNALKYTSSSRSLCGRDGAAGFPVTRLSLVIPCYNEARNLPLLVERCAPIAVPGEVEIVLVDNGSLDDTHDILGGLIAQYPAIRTVRVGTNQGYGFGVLSGLAAAHGEFLAWTHADLQTDPADAIKALNLAERAMRPQQVLVKGSRVGRALRDVVFTWGMSAFETLLLRQPLWDINGQPNLFHRSFFESWRDPPHDFSLDLYTYYMAVTAGFEVVRFPVVFGQRYAGVGHNDLISAKMRLSLRTMRYSVNLRRQLRAQRTTVLL